MNCEPGAMVAIKVKGVRNDLNQNIEVLLWKEVLKNSCSYKQLSVLQMIAMAFNFHIMQHW